MRVTGYFGCIQLSNFRNKRKYYGECAKYIAAFGEVNESLGRTGVKAQIMERYKVEYSRRRAFHDELRSFGMRK